MASDGIKRIMTIDQGNSSAKVVVWEDGKPVRTGRLFDVAIEGLLPLLGDYGFDGCVYCSVGHTDAKFLETLRRLMEWRLLVLTPSTPLPIAVEYGSRSTLGNDRVAAAVGASRVYPGEGVLVVDAGTAVTIDVIGPSGCFMGGNIAPGILLRLESLHAATSRLPLVSPEGKVRAFGTDTVSAIRCGVVGGMVSEIADAFSKAREAYGCSRIAMTGNDAELLVPLLRERGLPVDIHPLLVGYGLLSIFLHADEYGRFGSHGFRGID